VSYFPSYIEQTKVTYEYDGDGKLIKQSHFTDKDTTKLEFWKNFHYDRSGQLVKETKTDVDIQGQYHTIVTHFETVISNSEKIIQKVTRVKQGGIREVVYHIDSIYQGYQFKVVIRQSEPSESDKKALRIGRKSLSRSYSSKEHETKDILAYSISNDSKKLISARRTYTAL